MYPTLFPYSQHLLVGNFALIGWRSVRLAFSQLDIRPIEMQFAHKIQILICVFFMFALSSLHHIAFLLCHQVIVPTHFLISRHVLLKKNIT